MSYPGPHSVPKKTLNLWYSLTLWHSTKKQTDALIKLIKRCERNPGVLTFEGVQDLEHSWDNADKLLTPVRTLMCYLYVILTTSCVTSLI